MTPPPKGPLPTRSYTGVFILHMGKQRLRRVQAQTADSRRKSRLGPRFPSSQPSALCTPLPGFAKGTRCQGQCYWNPKDDKVRLALRSHGIPSPTSRTFCCLTSLDREVGRVMGINPFNFQTSPRKDFEESKAQCKKGSPFPLLTLPSLLVSLWYVGPFRKSASWRGAKDCDCHGD